jgi:glycosyltransferase involved in cell wall biosynthesis
VSGDTCAPIHVLFIEQFAVGGLFHYAHSLCQALAERGIKVSLLTASDHELADVPRSFRLLSRLPLWNPYAVDRRWPRGLAWRLEQMGKGLRYLWALGLSLVTIWRERPDIVHTSEMKFAVDLLTFLLPRCFRIVNTCHNVQRFSGTKRAITRGGRLWHQAQCWMYRRCDGVIFHAAQNVEEFRRTFGFEPLSWTVIPHGEYDLFAPEQEVSTAEARRALELDEKERLVLFFGALRQYKGLSVLLEAMPHLRRDLPGVRLVVAGAPLRDIDVQDLYAQARRLDVEDSVVWRVGYVPHREVHLYFYACDVVALPYLKIYDSGVLKIAQALGRPVVVTDTGGLRAAVDGGQAGLVVPAGDPEALARALVTLLCDRSLAQTLARRGQELAHTKFGWASVAEKTGQFYARVMNLPCAS